MQLEIETIYSIVKESKTVYKTDQTAERKKVISSADAGEIVRALIGEEIEVREHFYIMLLNRANQVLAVQKLSEGSQSGTVVDTKIIIKTACDLLAHSVILFHNHPSGNTTPSKEDINLTTKIKTVLEMIDIKLLDHIILTPNNSYYSFADMGDI